MTPKVEIRPSARGGWNLFIDNDFCGYDKSKKFLKQLAEEIIKNEHGLYLGFARRSLRPPKKSILKTRTCPILVWKLSFFNQPIS